MVIVQTHRVSEGYTVPFLGDDMVPLAAFMLSPQLTPVQNYVLVFI